MIKIKKLLNIFLGILITVVGAIMFSGCEHTTENESEENEDERIYAPLKLIECVNLKETDRSYTFTPSENEISDTWKYDGKRHTFNVVSIMRDNLEVVFTDGYRLNPKYEFWLENEDPNQDLYVHNYVCEPGEYWISVDIPSYHYELKPYSTLLKITVTY